MLSRSQIGLQSGLFLRARVPEISGFSYPYRALLPKRIEYLRVAGKCGSATHLGHAAGKSMETMMEIGQAAGVGTALCSLQKMAPRQVDARQVQDYLCSMGVRLFSRPREGSSET